MAQNFRLDQTGLINREKKLSFKFNGKKYFGYEGDTLASALIANGVHLVGRSFKYHRPRGFFGAGVDEPYAIVQLYRNGETEPNVRATEQELFEGLEAKSVNCWPSVNFDIGAINFYQQAFITKLLCGREAFGIEYTNHLSEKRQVLVLHQKNTIKKDTNINMSIVIY
jgi:hypothetical protein